MKLSHAFGPPSLGVNLTWTKRSDHAPKSGCADFYFKFIWQFWEKKIMFDLSPFLLPFFPHNFENVWQKKKEKKENEEKY